MNNFYIAIVSHGHDDYIINNSQLVSISNLDNVNVVIKDNIGSKKLQKYCEKTGYEYISFPLGVGFGENNNEIFRTCIINGMADDDWFLVVNPDVVLNLSNFNQLVSTLKNELNQLLTVNLFKGEKYLNSEDSLRYFPKWSNVLSMFLGKPINPSYDKILLKDKSSVEWASGAFLIFKASLYKELNGFSSKYFMYFEDVDICYRARYQKDQPVIYLKNVHAVHSGAYANRNPFSKHFRWYLASLFRFLIGKSS